MVENAYLHTGDVLSRGSGGGTPLSCALYFLILRLLLAFPYDWENETILPRRTETFQKISNMYGYLFVHITLHDFSVNFR